jgi:hypothetical protein
MCSDITRKQEAGSRGGRKDTRFVVKWVRDWMNHGTMIPELSGLVTEVVTRPIQAYYYVEFGNYDIET